ncbi:MAG TPA: carbonic anhydrase [Methanoregulaceae archaeon]|nr:carbonic anhydrase [Methanoregulaceae archaeon]
MKSNFLPLLIIGIMLIAVQSCVVTADPAMADLNASFVQNPHPFGDAGWIRLLTGTTGPGDVYSEHVGASRSPGINATDSPLIDQLLAGNQEFKNNDFDKNPTLYQDLAMAQNPGILWIGCSDSRSDPERITNAPPGELFVTRDIGNIVPNHDWNMASVVEYSINYLGVKEIVICGHSDCGAMKALDKNISDPYIPLWLNDAREAQVRIDIQRHYADTPDEQKERSHQIELENVRLQIEHLLTYPSVRQAVAEGRIQVHGLYYDLATGTLSRVT